MPKSDYHGSTCSQKSEHERMRESTMSPKVAVPDA